MGKKNLNCGHISLAFISPLEFVYLFIKFGISISQWNKCETICYTKHRKFHIFIFEDSFVKFLQNSCFFVSWFLINHPTFPKYIIHCYYSTFPDKLLWELVISWVFLFGKIGVWKWMEKEKEAFIQLSLSASMNAKSKVLPSSLRSFSRLSVAGPIMRFIFSSTPAFFQNSFPIEGYSSVMSKPNTFPSSGTDWAKARVPCPVKTPISIIFFALIVLSRNLRKLTFFIILIFFLSLWGIADEFQKVSPL